MAGEGIEAHLRASRFQLGHDPIAQLFVCLRTGRTLTEGHGLLGVFEGDRTAESGLGAGPASKVAPAAATSRRAAGKVFSTKSRLD